MEPDVLKSKVARARKLLFECGCHFVIDTVVELPEVIEEINRRLALGIAP
jgi:phosphonoacetaldehyde hydrolase